MEKHNVRGGKSAKLNLEEFRAVLIEVEEARQKFNGKERKSVSAEAAL